MKNLLMFTVVALLAVNAVAKDFKVRVANLNCQNCANRMEAVLKQSKSVKKVQFDLPTKTVTISYKGKKSNQQSIRKMIEDAKFNIVEEGKAMPSKNDPTTQCTGQSEKGQSSCGRSKNGGNCHKDK